MIILADQNFPAVLPTADGSCLAIIRIDQGKISDLVDLLFSISPEEFPHGTIFVLGSLTHLQGEGLQGYATAGVKAGKKIALKFPDAYSVLFTPPPMGGCDNPQLVREILDCCCWLSTLPAYPLKGSMKVIREIIGDYAKGEGVPLVAYLPHSLTSYSYDSSFVTSAGRSDIPASLPDFDQPTEKKFIKALIMDLNQNLISGRDAEPNLSRSAMRPVMYYSNENGSC